MSLLCHADPVGGAFEEDLDSSRGGGWQYFVNFPAEARVLEIGCGSGSLDRSLAERVAELHYLDPDTQRLRKLAALAEEHGLDSFHGVQTSYSLPLPFEDNYFDVVNLNGIVERVPDWVPGNPRRAQTEFLCEVRRILKPTGQVFAGLDNRYALKYLCGRPQQNVGLRWASVLPRWLANLACLVRQGKIYRNYTYSAFGLRRLFQNAGFADIQTLVLAPDFLHFDRVMGIADKTQIASMFPSGSGWKGRFYRAVGRTGMLSWFVPAFGIVATPDSSQDWALRGVQRPIAPANPLDPFLRHVNCNQSATYEIERLSVREHGGVIALLHSPVPGGKGAVLKLAFNDTRGESLKVAAGKADQMSAALEVQSIVVPRMLEQGTLNGHAYLLEERLKGRTGFELISRDWSPVRLATTAWQFLEDWQRNTQCTVRMTQEDFERWLPRPADPWRRLPTSRAVQDFEDLWSRVGAYIIGRERIVTASHGDLSLGNLLFAEDTGKVTGVIDWESGSVQGLPLVDALCLSYCPGIDEQSDGGPFDMGFFDEFAERHSVRSLMEALRRVASARLGRVERIRAQYGYLEDQDYAMALLVVFLRRHQPGNYPARRQTTKWLEAFQTLLAD